MCIRDRVTGGYELVFTDGSKITIKNGTNGTDGAAGTTVNPEFRVEGNYWQVSTDKGDAWVDVKDTEGNKVPARGCLLYTSWLFLQSNASCLHLIIQIVHQYR